MSTSYYRLRPPVTYLQIVGGAGHDGLSIWVNHALVGTLTLANRETKSFLKMFSEWYEPPIRTHWGGPDRGAVVTVVEEDLSDEELLISEYGQLLTVAQIKARDGAKRKDGMPTELFGYEEASDDTI